MKARLVQPKELTTKTLRPADYLKKKAKTTKPKPTPERIPRYTDAEGGFLVAAEVRGVYQIAWAFPEDDREAGGLGMVLSNDSYRGQNMEECRVAADAIREYSRAKGIEHPRGADFTFDTLNQVKEALRAANAALHFWKKQQPLPEWAQTALAAGWLPPKGWKP